MGFAGWAVLSASRTAARVGQDTVSALWLVPPLMLLHLVQLLISAQAWRLLLRPARPALPWLWRLRVVREGIDSLLPVAQVGGELAAAQILARRGVPLSAAAASMVVDLTLEFISQLAFLLIGMATLTWIAPGGAWQGWLGIGLLSAAALAGLLAAQRLGGLRLLEKLSHAIARRWPALNAVSLEGLQQATVAIYQRTGKLVGAGLLHLLAWLLGSIETWAVLHALGVPVSPAAAIAVESLGMAARSAGFAVPGALVIQETGFVLAAASVGVPEAAGLALSLVKRVREVAVGLIGLALWQRELA